MNRSPENIARLAEEHVERYEHQLSHARAGHRGYLEQENRELLAIWQSIQRKDCRWERMIDAEQDEVIDALHDEE